MTEYIVESNPYPTIKMDGYSVRCDDWLIQREEIVRCRDCKHFTPKGTHKFENGKTNADSCLYVRGWLLQITPNGFCAWGKMRESC